MAGQYKYRKEVYEYIKVRCETCNNNTQIAKEIREVFRNDEIVQNASNHALRHLVNKKRLKNRREIKRLFFDIETSPLFGWFWRTGKQWVNYSQIIEDKKIICISYKWQGSDEVKTLQWSNKTHSDKKIIKDFIKILGEADEIIAHNGDRYDIKEIRTRAIQEGLLMFPKYRTLDTLKKARKYFNFHSNKLDYLGEVLKVGRKIEHEGIDLWLKVCKNDSKALSNMIQYCEQDVILLEDVFHVLSPYIDHNTNHAVQMGGKKYDCPECGSKKVSLCHTDTTPMGYIKRHMKCHDCKKQYHISNKSYLSFLSK